MQFDITLISIIVLVAVVWVLLEMKRFKHKIFAIFIVLAILFTYFSFTFALSGKEVDLSTFGGIKDAGAIYFSWLGSIFSNFKALTTNAIHMDWRPSSEANSSINLTSPSKS